MIRAHLFLDGELASRIIINHCPRVGETIRFSENKYGKVTEVIWCLDEPETTKQRVNIRVEGDDK